jgi:hypothetical protein
VTSPVALAMVSALLRIASPGAGQSLARAASEHEDKTAADSAGRRITEFFKTQLGDLNADRGEMR